MCININYILMIQFCVMRSPVFKTGVTQITDDTKEVACCAVQQWCIFHSKSFDNGILIYSNRDCNQAKVINFFYLCYLFLVIF